MFSVFGPAFATLRSLRRGAIHQQEGRLLWLSRCSY